jgi:hypothetical protein
MEIFFGVGAIITALLTSGFVLSAYVFLVPSFVIFGHEYSILAYGYWGLEAYVAFALLSGYETRHKGLYWTTFATAIIACVCITVSFVTVVFRAVTSAGTLPTDLNSLLQLAGSMQFIIGLFLFSWFDAIYIQIHKWHELVTGEAPVRRQGVDQPARGAGNPPARPVTGSTELIGTMEGGNFFNVPCATGSSVDINLRDDGPPQVRIHPAEAPPPASSTTNASAVAAA